MTAKRLPRIVSIDQSPHASRSLELQGSLLDLWQTDKVQWPAELHAITAEPDLVVLHPQLGADWTFEQFIPVLKAKNWLGKTVLVTSHPESVAHLQDFIQKHGMLGMVSHGSLPNWLEENLRVAGGADALVEPATNADEHAVSLSGASEIKDFVDALKPAVVVFYAESDSDVPQAIWGNQTAWNYINDSASAGDTSRLLNRSDLERIDWLRRQRREGPPLNKSYGHLLDWDVEKKGWVGCRLHDLSGGYFWYTRDWQTDAMTEDAIALIQAKRTLHERFDGLADYLAQRWSITRVRLYQIAVLPRGLSEIESKDMFPRIVSLTTVAAEADIDSFLVVPRMQSGMGWKDEDTVKNWWFKHFNWHEFSEKAAKPVLQNGLHRQTIEPANLADGHHYLFEQVASTAPGNGADEDARCGANDWVDFGNASARLLLLVPQRVGAVDNSGGAPMLAMLALDRRDDHLDKPDEFRLKEEERQRIGQGRYTGRRFDADVVRQMDGGTLKELRQRLGQWLVDDHQVRLRTWHEIISEQILKNLLPMLPRGGMAALSAMCASLSKAWPTLWDEEQQRLQPDRDWFSAACATENGIASQESDIAIVNWFFVTRRTRDTIDMPAGHGPVWNHYRRQKDGLPLVLPMRHLFDDRAEQWMLYVEQDFQTWYESLKNQNRLYRNIPEIEKIRTWVGIRLPAVQGFPQALMVVHFGGRPNCAWDTEAHLLLVAAKRLFAPFMLAHAELHERSMWAGAVVHEIKNQVLDTRAWLEDGCTAQALELLDATFDLTEDFLETLDEFQGRPSDEALRSIQTGIPADWLKQSLGPWQTRFAPTLTLEVIERAAKTVQLSAFPLWRRVVRVLLHNAFRHGRDEVRITLDCQERSGLPRLLLTVWNRADDYAIGQLRELATQEDRQISLGTQRAYVRQRLGMRAARALIDMVAGASMEHDYNQLGAVRHELIWPLHSCGGAAMMTNSQGGDR